MSKSPAQIAAIEKKRKRRLWSGFPSFEAKQAYDKKYYQEHKKQVYEASRKYRLNNREKYRSYQTKYRLKNMDKCRIATVVSRRKHPETAKEYAKKYRAVNKEQHQVYQDKYRQNIQRYKAHKMVQVAVHNGSLARLPCEMCGVSRAVAHHPDYSKPLKVVWLCSLHHADAHKLIKRSILYV